MAEGMNIFQTNIDDGSKRHLLQAAKWARIASIFGFITTVAIVIIAIYLSTKSSKYKINYSYTIGEKIGGFLYYLFLAFSVFYPSFLLNKFSNNISNGLAQNSQQHITTAFKNLKSLFKYVVIFSIVIALLISLAVLVNVSDIMSLK